MSGVEDSIPDDPECGVDAAAYALGALDEREAIVFRRHLADCAVCHDELAAFAQIVDTLPEAAPQVEVSRALRRRVMRAVRADASASRPRAAHRPARRTVRVAIPRAVVATAATAAAVVGSLVLSSGGSAPTRVIQASVIDSSGSAEVKLAAGRAELIVNDLPPPPARRIYEVWLQRPHRLEPTRALFSVTSNGAADVGVPGALRGVSAILVTQEPAGGSPTPTREPVIVARLT